MPPNQKITKEMILEAGYQIVRTDGIESVNSRSIAKTLRCSTQPVFSQFPTMTELRQGVHDYACRKFEQDVLYDAASGSFIQSSYLKVTELAKEEKNVFALIYLSEYCGGNDFLRTRMKYESNQRIWKEIKERYRLGDDDCADVLERISLLVQGLATLIATSNVRYEDARIIRIVEQTLEDILNGIKGRSKEA